jgi:hypothetical protein
LCPCEHNSIAVFGIRRVRGFERFFADGLPRRFYKSKRQKPPESQLDVGTKISDGAPHDLPRKMGSE